MVGEWSIFEGRRSYDFVGKPREAMQTTAIFVIQQVDGRRVAVWDGTNLKEGRFKRFYWALKICRVGAICAV